MEALRQFAQAAVPYLCEALERRRFVEGVEPPGSEQRRSRAAELLGQLKAREALSVLQAGVHDESEPVRVASSIALAEMGIATEAVLCQLITGLEDPDLLVRKNCKERLQKLGGEAVPFLKEVAGGNAIYVSHDNQVRLSLNGRLVAIKLLGLIQEAGAVRCLIGLLKDPKEIVRYRSVAALQNFADAEVRATLEWVAREDSSKRVRMRVKEALEISTTSAINSEASRRSNAT